MHTAGGLRSLSDLKRLEWLWLDDSHCTETGLALLRGLRPLRAIWLNFDDVDTELLDDRRNAKPACKIVDLQGREEVPLPSSDITRR